MLRITQNTLTLVKLNVTRNGNRFWRNGRVLNSTTRAGQFRAKTRQQIISICAIVKIFYCNICCHAENNSKLLRNHLFNDCWFWNCSINVFISRYFSSKQMYRMSIGTFGTVPRLHTTSSSWSLYALYIKRWCIERWRLFLNQVPLTQWILRKDVNINVFNILVTLRAKFEFSAL